MIETVASDQAVRRLARELNIPRTTLQTWKDRGWLHVARRLPGIRGQIIYWADDRELDRLRRLRRAKWQPPVLQRTGVVNPARLTLQQGQVVDWLEEGPLPVPAPRVLGHESISIDQTDFFDRDHHEELPMGVLDRHRVVVVIEPYERLRIGRSVGDAAGLERLLGQWQEKSTRSSQPRLTWD